VATTRIADSAQDRQKKKGTFRVKGVSEFHRFLQIEEDKANARSTQVLHRSVQSAIAPGPRPAAAGWATPSFDFQLPINILSPDGQRNVLCFFACVVPNGRAGSAGNDQRGHPPSPARPGADITVNRWMSPQVYRRAGDYPSQQRLSRLSGRQHLLFQFRITGCTKRLGQFAGLRSVACVDILASALSFQPCCSRRRYSHRSRGQVFQISKARLQSDPGWKNRGGI